MSQRHAQAAASRQAPRRPATDRRDIVARPHVRALGNLVGDGKVDEHASEEKATNGARKPARRWYEGRWAGLLRCGLVRAPRWYMKFARERNEFAAASRERHTAPVLRVVQYCREGGVRVAQRQHALV